MKRIQTLLTASIALLTAAVIAPQRLPGEAPVKRDTASEGWKLVWADEFDKAGRPDPRKWGYESGFVRNNEFQWYQPENAWCQDGMLIIEGRRVRKRNPNFGANTQNWITNREYADYTSASLTTRGLHAWQYGRFEMRARIDTRPGIWPAFWTLGVQGDWPANGEIDISS